MSTVRGQSNSQRSPMRRRAFLALTLGVVLASIGPKAAAQLTEGKNYFRLKSPVQVESGKKIEVILKDGGGKTQPLHYDQAVAAWRARYRVPLHPATERFGLSVTAKNAQKLQQRVWVFLQVREAAVGEAAGTAAEPDSQ